MPVRGRQHSSREVIGIMERVVGNLPASQRFRQGSWSAFHLLYKRAIGEMLGEDIDTFQVLLKSLEL